MSRAIPRLSRLSLSRTLLKFMHTPAQDGKPSAYCMFGRITRYSSKPSPARRNPAKGVTFFELSTMNETKKEKLLARTPWWSNLGIYSLEMSVDPSRSRVIIKRRILWFFKTRRALNFGEIRCVVYDYQGPSVSAAVRLLSDNDWAEEFSVGLKLQDMTILPLFSFGRQEEESRTFAESLSEMIGVPIGRS
jgi:hypothetical protein